MSAIYVLFTVALTVYGQLALKWHLDRTGPMPSESLAACLFLLKATRVPARHIELCLRIPRVADVDGRSHPHGAKRGVSFHEPCVPACSPSFCTSAWRALYHDEGDWHRLHPRRSLPIVAIKMADATIPFNRPGLAGNEWRYMSETLEAMHISGDGAFTKKCQALLENELGAARVLLTTSCTAALEMTALLLNLREGDEIIVPSFAFVSTVNAYVLRGAVPVFCDIRPDTLNLNESKIEELITPRSKAIVVFIMLASAPKWNTSFALQIMLAFPSSRTMLTVCLARGVADISKLRPIGHAELSRDKKLFLWRRRRARYQRGCFVDRAEILWEKGTNRKRFFRGLVDKYSWIDVGSSFLPSDLLAAFLYAQLEARHSIQTKRGAIWHRYHNELKEWAMENNVQQPHIPRECENPYHMYYLLLPDRKQRNAFIQAMHEKGIMCVFHYLPLHLSQMGIKFGGGGHNAPSQNQ